MTALIVSQVILWIVVLAMGIVIAALTRQVGVLHERLAPVGALSIGNDPEVGSPAPRLSVRALSGDTVEIGVPRELGSLLLFVSPDCPICKKIIPVAQRVGMSETLDVIFVGDGPLAQQHQMAQHFGISPSVFVNGSEVGMAFRVSKLPYAVLIGADGLVAAKGLVNSREHLESLAVAHETGYSSIQAYLKDKGITTIANDGRRAGRDHV